jgi:hypothetical protein
MNGYAAGVGYDLTTGLGSVDAYAMALNWGAHGVTGPGISTLSPNPMAASASAQPLTITGSNFAAGATVQASYAGGPVTALTVTGLTSTMITTSIVTGLVTRTWNIVVTNPSGLASRPAGLQVNAPAPTPAITSLSPNPMTGSTASQVLAINGSGFQSGTGLKVTLTYPGGPTTTVSGGQIAFVNSGQILAMVNVGTTARTWSVTVTNPSSIASTPATLAVVAAPPPAISSLTPNPMTHSEASQTLTINGSGFSTANGLKVLASYPGFSSTMQGGQITSVTATRITVSIRVGNTPRNWTIQVVNADGQSSNGAALQVK